MYVHSITHVDVASVASAINESFCCEISSIVYGLKLDLNIELSAFSVRSNILFCFLEFFDREDGFQFW
jgi:hypothetical protein